ncbi:glycosyltransferase [Nonomuraea sp. NPDC050328]|uniref:glycosyltransferase n=1 Tax=Nonomuraea sp. NPDC050328 TaxID=3364361 RepID=UPI003794E3E9
MKVDLISEHADPLAALGGVDAGGQNVYVSCLAAALAARGHDVVVHTRRTALGQRAVTLPTGVRVEYVPAGPPLPIPKDDLPPYMAQFAGHLARGWRRRRPDVVHAHFWMSGLAALEAARGSIPVVQTYHALGTVKRRWQGAADTSPRVRLAAEARLGRQADAVLATCTDEVAELRAMGVPAERISIVPCGVDLQTFCPEPGGRPVPGRILSIGRLVPRKGVETVVRALAELPEAHLVVAGGSADDKEARRLAELALTLGVAGRVRVLGSVSRHQVPALMRSAQVVASVPWYEPFGLVPVEAMACGVPVIASAVGGHLDTVAGAGLLVPPREPLALATALRRVLEAPELRFRLGRAGARRAQERYGWPRVAEQVEQVYRQLARGSATELLASGS